MPEPRILHIADATRLDQLLVQTWPGLDRQAVRQLVQAGEVQVNDQPALKAGMRLAPGDEVRVHSEPQVAEAIPDPIVPATFSITHADDSLLIIEKPAGVALRPGRRQSSRLARIDFSATTVAQYLCTLYPEIAHIGGANHAGLVLPLETEASGLVIAARTEEAYRTMRHHIQHQRVELHYSALVEGRLTGEGVIEQPIGNVKRAHERLAVAREGRPARTFYRVQRHYREDRAELKYPQDYSLLLVRPESSRLHQIRVHLSWYGYPLVGDRLYGSRRPSTLADRLFLHLGVVEFPHPLTGEPLHIESRLPADLYGILRYLARPKH